MKLMLLFAISALGMTQVEHNRRWLLVLIVTLAAGAAAMLDG